MNIIERLSEKLWGKETPQINPQDIISMINDVPSGKHDRITQVEMYKDVIAINFEKENPVIGIMYESFPLGMNIFPEENDEVIFVKEGVSVPIIYNKTANAYLYSESSDLFINEYINVTNEFIDITRLRERLKSQNEPNTFKRVLETIYENELSRFFVKLKSPLLIYKMLSFVKFTFNFDGQQRRFLRNVSLEGSIKSINSFSFESKSRNGITQITYIIPIRIYCEAINNFLSVIYRKRPIWSSKKINIPPINSRIKIVGKIHTQEKYIQADSIFFGKNKIM